MLVSILRIAQAQSNKQTKRLAFGWWMKKREMETVSWYRVLMSILRCRVHIVSWRLSCRSLSLPPANKTVRPSVRLSVGLNTQLNRIAPRSDPVRLLLLPGQLIAAALPSITNVWSRQQGEWLHCAPPLPTRFTADCTSRPVNRAFPLLSQPASQWQRHCYKFRPSDRPAAPVLPLMCRSPTRIHGIRCSQLMNDGKTFRRGNNFPAAISVFIRYIRFWNFRA